MSVVSFALAVVFIITLRENSKNNFLRRWNQVAFVTVSSVLELKKTMSLRLVWFTGC